MLPKIKELKVLDDFMLQVSFDDNKTVLYNVKEDIDAIPSYKVLETEIGLFNTAKVDTSRTVVEWGDDIDLPSDIIYEYGKEN